MWMEKGMYMDNPSPQGGSSCCTQPGELLLRMRTGALGLCCDLKREEGRPREAEALCPRKGLESHILQRKITVTLHPPHMELSHS